MARLELTLEASELYIHPVEWGFFFFFLLHEAMSKGHDGTDQLIHDTSLELVRCKDVPSKLVSSGCCKPHIHGDQFHLISAAGDSLLTFL